MSNENIELSRLQSGVTIKVIEKETLDNYIGDTLLIRADMVYEIETVQVGARLVLKFVETEDTVKAGNVKSITQEGIGVYTIITSHYRLKVSRA